MLQSLIACVVLACALFATRGLTQTPAQCVHNLRIETGREDLYIMPGVVNCISCNIMGDIAWTIEVEGDQIPTTSSTAAQFATAVNNYLIIAMPEDYVEPGTSGRQDIRCSAPAGSPALEARLASPILREPLFDDVTIREGATLKVTCITRNIPDITSSQILDPSGMAVPIEVGVFTVENSTRDFSGVYTCVVTNTLNNNTISATSTVVVEFAPEVTARNDTMTPHPIILAEELRLGCGYVGVPAPTVQFFQNSMLLMDGMNSVTIIGGAPSDNEITLVISSVGRMSGGTYTCRANNSVGMDEVVYSVIIQVPADPVTNLMVTAVTETSVSLSWMTGFDGFTPITGIEILVTPERGAAPSTNPIVLPPSNQTIISNLLPFREHEFSVAVLNLAGTSERVNTTANTLSLRLGAPINLNLVAESSTSLRFTWDPPNFDSDTTDDPNFYLIQFSRTTGEDVINLNVSASETRERIFSQLAKGTEYYVRIDVVNDAGNGTMFATIQRETLVDPPSMPENLVVSGVGAMALFANWTAPADNGGRPLSAYRVIIDSIGFSQMIADPGITSLLIRDDQLVQNTTYTVRVSAANAAQGFGANATDMARTQSILEPQTIFDEPLSIDGESTNSSAMISWVNPGGTVDYYVIQYVLARDGFDSNNVVTVLVGPNDTSVIIADENILPGATYSFRIAVNNSRGMSAFSPLGRFETLDPDPAIITTSHTNPVLEGTTVLLNCSATLRGTITYSWTKDGSVLPSDQQLETNPTQGYLRIPMVTEDSAGNYVCTASISEDTKTLSAPYSLVIQPMEPPEEGGIDQNVIIIVASVGGAALLIFVIVVIFAVACLCKMKAKSAKSSYAMKPMKSKDRSNANWIETSTQFVPATGNQASNTTDGDRLAFDYSVDLQTHSSFNTLEKQKVHSTANGSDQPPPSYSTDNATDV